MKDLRYALISATGEIVELLSQDSRYRQSVGDAQNGVVVFEANALGYSNVSPYSNNVARVGVGAYVDPMGNLLFEEITIK